MARYVLDQLIRFGEVRRGTLGLIVQDLSGDLAGAFGIDNSQGALVAEVLGSSAADEAGLQPGDVILTVADKVVRNAQDFLNAEGQVPVGETVRIGYMRDRKPRRASLLIQPSPELDGEEIDRRFAGALFTEVPAKLRNDRNVGVLIAELEPRSRLAYEGLRPGDIITAANRERIRNLGDLREVLDKVRGSILLQIRRNGEAYFARIE
jgi:S1-C subfamily serine protease